MSGAQNVQALVFFPLRFEYVNLFVILKIPILIMPFPAHAKFFPLYNVNNCWTVY